MYKALLCCLFYSLISFSTFAQSASRSEISFNKTWRFSLGDFPQASQTTFDDSQWRVLNLPHDWSIEGQFAENHLATVQGGALPTGIAWYRKQFLVNESSQKQLSYIEFDGVYRNAEVWINGHYLGKRPYGYSSFRYELTPFLNFGKTPNILAVRVDNSEQPNSRWYSGSGIYRNVRLVHTATLAIDQWGTFVTTPKITAKSATVLVQVNLRNQAKEAQTIRLKSSLLDATGKEVATQLSAPFLVKDTLKSLSQNLELKTPTLWSLENPYLYSLVIQLITSDNQVLDTYQTNVGICYFNFDAKKGFFLNGVPTKILGVCNHHDLGALGAAVNVRAIERQLEILKKMGCNGIRVSHNPPAPELLDLCDKMGFIVMDEAFDMWKKKKNKKDYSQNWNDWHKRDLEDMIKRDRNHPSIFVWSIGNEIREQFDSTGTTITKELVGIVKALDTTRPVTSALTEMIPAKNFIVKAGVLDVLGFNYKHEGYADLVKNFPNTPLIATETASALETRGRYDMPKDSVQFWPKDGKAKLVEGNADWTASAFDNVAAYWGTTHEISWNAVKKYPNLAGLYVWSGFDYLGEPHPYNYPARSSYFGIIDLAGFPKDVYYMYQSEWTQKPVLHLLPHWNWTKGQTIDVWAYYSQADEVELFLNDKSLGIRKKVGDALHVSWKVPFEEGTLKAISRKNGQPILTDEIKTANKASKINLTADRSVLKANGEDLSFVTVSVTDEKGIEVPTANHLINFSVEGVGELVGVDNGYQASQEPFKANYRKAYNGKCLAIVRTKEQVGKVIVTASGEGLETQQLVLETR
ncbi:MAG: beta-galactosidase GalB [Spirosomataceae bacterium]